MNKPPLLNAFLVPSADQRELGSVEAPLFVRLIRPVTFTLWVIVFCVEAQRIISGETSNYLVIGLSTLLFAGVHIQFWYEESEQGRRFHRALDRMRGGIYEDDQTGLPNSRHFVFELRRQMMRSVRNGRGFSLVLTDLGGTEKVKLPEERLLTTISRAMRQSLGEGAFVAHLQGSVFAAVIADDHERTAAEKADNLLPALGACIPLEHANNVFPVVSLTGYEGELEVRDFLRRAQRDLASVRVSGPRVMVAVSPRTNRDKAAA